MPITFTTEVTLGNLATVVTLGGPIIAFLWRFGRRIDEIERTAAEGKREAAAATAKSNKHADQIILLTSRLDIAERKAEEACLKAKSATESIYTLTAAIHADKIVQAERLVTRDMLREVKDEFRGFIKDMFAGITENLAQLREQIARDGARRLPPPGE